MRLSQTIANIPNIVKTDDNLEIEIKGLTHDSRKVSPDFLFVAVQGLVSDGHKYVNQAIKQGATAIVYDRENIQLPADITGIQVRDSREALPHLAANFYGHPEAKLVLIGITGTNGKTSSNYFLQHIANSAGLKAGRIGTTGAEFMGTEIDLIHTTPEASDLYEILSTFEKAGAHAATLEVSSHALDQGRVDGLHFQAAIFSNLTQDHLDYHPSFEDYLKVKQQLFTGLTKDAVAIINTDDPHAAQMVENCQARVISYGYDEAADYCITSQHSNDTGTVLTIKSPTGLMTIQTNTVGKFNTYNYLSALATALELGCDAGLAINASQSLPIIPGRLEKMHNKAPFKVFVDYAHTPDALSTVLHTLSETYPNNRLIAVFGCGGDRDQSKRSIMGEIVTRLSTNTIITDDNPRTEAPMDIINSIAEGCEGRTNYSIIQDRSTAVRSALDKAEAGDVIVILGKGHEPYQEIMGKRIPYSDMKIVEQFMEQHGY